MKLTKDELSDAIATLLQLLAYTDAQTYEPITKSNTDGWVLSNARNTVGTLTLWLKELDNETSP